MAERTVEVQLIVTWDLPESEAKPWVEHVNNLWKRPASRPDSLLSITCHAPGGYQPELKLVLIEPVSPLEPQGGPNVSFP